jgi:hypothetical protein
MMDLDKYVLRESARRFTFPRDLVDPPPETFREYVLAGLQRKPQYEGTAPDAVVAGRRAANKRARVARRANRA